MNNARFSHQSRWLPFVQNHDGPHCPVSPNKSARTCASRSFFRPLLCAIVCSVPLGRLPAQTFKVLHSFSAVSGPESTNTDGAYPYYNLISYGDTLYGTASGGGSGHGALFSVNAGGANFTLLRAFSGFDGASPQSGLVGSGNPFYGTTSFGGPGTLFRVYADGTGFDTLFTFTNTSGKGGDGLNPRGLALSGNSIYGVTVDDDLGGGVGLGTVFKLNTDGTGFTTLYRFKNDGDGQFPYQLLLSGSTLYGTASGRGLYTTSNGTVFSLNIDGTGFEVLHGFSDTSASPTNSDGSFPRCLILSGNTLYGTTSAGGSGGNGTVFKLNTDGTDFMIIHDFAVGTFSGRAGLLGNPGITNNDGVGPTGLTLSRNTLYGVAGWGGLSGNGTLFAVDTNGATFQVLHHFSAIPAAREC